MAHNGKEADEASKRSDSGPSLCHFEDRRTATRLLRQKEAWLRYRTQHPSIASGVCPGSPIACRVVAGGISIPDVSLSRDSQIQSMCFSLIYLFIVKASRAFSNDIEIGNT